MEKLVVNDIYDLAERVYAYAEEGNTVYSVLFYDQASALMRAFLEYEEVSCERINLDDGEGSKYKKEYYVILDSEMKLSVEPAYSSNNYYTGYLSFYADVAFIDGEASSYVIKAIDNSDCECFELYIDECVLCNDTDDSYNDVDSSAKLLFDFIRDLFFDDDDDEYEQEDDDDYIEDPVIEFIQRRFPKDSNWCSENCYYFALILQDRFPGGDIYYDVINGHFSYKYRGNYYDHTGLIDPDGYLVSWYAFDKYDSIQQKRIIRDCIL